MITDPSAREVLREIVDTVVGPTVSFEQIIEIMLNIANNILRAETRPTSGYLDPKERNVKWHSMLATPSLDGDLQNAHRSILAPPFGGILDPSYEESDINELLDTPDPAMLHSARLKTNNPSALTSVQNNQIAFRYTDKSDVAFADMRADTGICTIWKSFWREGRLKSFTELSVKAGDSLDLIRFSLCLGTIVHECFHSRASIEAVDAHIDPSDVPDDLKQWVPGPYDDSWNEDKTEFVVLTFEDCLMCVAINIRKKTRNTLTSAVNIHYLVILILLFLKFPQYNFTSGYAVPRSEPAHIDPIFRKMGGTSDSENEQEDDHASNKRSDDANSEQGLSAEHREARGQVIWLLVELDGGGE